MRNAKRTEKKIINNLIYFEIFFEEVLANQFRNRYTTIKIISIKIK
jgi:hypothetical protein